MPTIETEFTTVHDNKFYEKEIELAIESKKKPMS
jgi:hypothetical protein